MGKNPNFLYVTNDIHKFCFAYSSLDSILSRKMQLIYILQTFT